MKYVFVGGPGRSGTSVFVHRLQLWPAIGSFLDNELKFFSEADGIWDLYWNFVKAFSPQRAPMALKRFRLLAEDVATSSERYVGLAEHVGESAFRNIVERALGQLTSKEGIATQVTEDQFLQIFADMTSELAGLLTYPCDVPLSKRVFVEKTPHNLLRTNLISRLPLEHVFIHVMRDPRLIAASLEKMPWGPGDLFQCCQWVEQYIIAMKNRFIWARENGIVIHSLFVEGIAAQKIQHVGYLQEVLAVTGDETIFDTLTPEALRMSADSLTSESRVLLNAVLGEYAEALGYSAAIFGLRIPEEIEAFQTPNGLAGAHWVEELPMSQLACKSDPDSPT